MTCLNCLSPAHPKRECSQVFNKLINWGRKETTRYSRAFPKREFNQPALSFFILLIQVERPLPIGFYWEARPPPPLNSVWMINFTKYLSLLMWNSFSFKKQLRLFSTWIYFLLSPQIINLSLTILFFLRFPLLAINCLYWEKSLTLPTTIQAVKTIAVWRRKSRDVRGTLPCYKLNHLLWRNKTVTQIVLWLPQRLHILGTLQLKCLPCLRTTEVKR